MGHAPVWFTSARGVDRGQEVLAIDSTSYHALEAAAIALDTLKRRDEAATMYLPTDTANLELVTRVIYSMVAGQNTKRAEPFVVELAAAHPEVLAFTQQKWRIAYDNRSWAYAIDAAEDLIVRDSIARSDSTFSLKLGTGYRAVNRHYDEIKTLAYTTKKFSGDVRIFSLYAQSIKLESDSVLSRGLARFPASTDVLAMSGNDLRARGRIAEFLDATKRAMKIDSTMAQDVWSSRNSNSNWGARIARSQHSEAPWLAVRIQRWSHWARATRFIERRATPD